MNEKTVSFDFEIETAFGVLPAYHLDVPDIPMGLKDVVPFVQQMALDIINQAAAVSAMAGNVVQCGTGCTKCCFYPFPISAPEAIYIVEYLIKLPLPERQPILKQFENNEQVCIQKSIIEPLRKSQLGIDVYQTGKLYYNCSLPCPFLREDKCCIHLLRPITCREHNVISSPELCTDPFSGKTTPLGLQRHYSERLQAFANNICDIGKGNVVMPLLFEWYENNREIANMRWRGPDLFALAIDFTAGNGAVE